MSLKRDSVTDWARRNGEAIEKHRSQDVASNNKVPTFMNQSVFGLASQIPGISKYTNSSYTLGLSPAALANGNWDLIRDRALTVGGNFLSNFINKSSTPENRKFLEKLDSDLVFGQFEGYRLNHKLEEVGYLGFAVADDSVSHHLFRSSTGVPNEMGIFDGFAGVSLPVTDARTDGYTMFKVPFFENPTITESRKPTYAKHPIVNRNEPYRLWTAGNPMTLDLKFSITLPHLITFAYKQLQKGILTTKFKRIYEDWLIQTAAKSAKLESTNLTPGDGLGYVFDKINDFGSSEGNPLRRFLTGEATAAQDVSFIAHKTMTEIQHTLSHRGVNGYGRQDVILYTLGLIGLIRASVMGERSHQTGPQSQTYIPPSLAFLKFGSLYQDFPCIVTNYNITFDGKAGYEELSLLPRVIKFSLKLESYHQFSTLRTPGLSEAFPVNRENPSSTKDIEATPSKPSDPFDSPLSDMAYHYNYPDIDTGINFHESNIRGTGNF